MARVKYYVELAEVVSSAGLVGVEDSVGVEGIEASGVEDSGIHTSFVKWTSSSCKILNCS